MDRIVDNCQIFEDRTFKDLKSSEPVWEFCGKDSSLTMICPYCYTTSTFKEVKVNIDSKVTTGSKEEIESVDDVEKGFSTLKKKKNHLK